MAERGAEIYTYESPSLVYGMNWSVSNGTKDSMNTYAGLPERMERNE